MSSACRCHTDEWCFYCEMYSPLEQKYENQRMAIGRVIADLEQRAQQSESVWRNKWADNREYHDGKEDGLVIAIDKLKEVLSQHGADDSSRVPEDAGAEAAQIPSEENGS